MGHHKISDVSEKSGTSEDTGSGAGAGLSTANKSPSKIPQTM